MKKEKIKKELRKVYHSILAAVLITTNIYFFIFVHYKSDLSPNFALLLITMPFIVMEIIKFVKLIREDQVKK